MKNGDVFRPRCSTCYIKRWHYWWPGV